MRYREGCGHCGKADLDFFGAGGRSRALLASLAFVLLTSVGAAETETFRIRLNAENTNAGEGSRVFNIDTDYGTLAFKGTIERTDMGDRYKFRVRLAVAFLPGEVDERGYTMTNRTKEADLRTCELVATEFIEEGKPYRLLQRESQPISILLTKWGDAGTLEDLEFFLPKQVVRRATHVGLSVIGSRLVWPVPVELK